MYYIIEKEEDNIVHVTIALCHFVCLLKVTCIVKINSFTMQLMSEYIM